MLLADRAPLEPGDFTTLTRSVAAQFRLPAEGLNLDEVERQLLMQALERAGGTRHRPASCSGSTATRCDTESRSSVWPSSA